MPLGGGSIVLDGQGVPQAMTNAILQTHMLLPIEEIARKLRCCRPNTSPLAHSARSLNSICSNNPAFPVRGKLILVTATTPTTSGEGKTVVSIGLAQGLERIGLKSI